MTQKEKDKIREALLYYGTVIRRKSDGHILTVKEMESLTLTDTV